jgi:non-ribosomal peptide synthetase component F
MLPTLYEVMLGGADNTDLSGLRQVIVAGETCPHKLPALHAEILPRCAIANEYGPTEATVWAIADNNSPGDGSPLTIGLPIAGMQVLLLDEAREVVPAGQTGEIALAGPGLATGYFNHPEDTDAAFVTRSMPDGSPMRFYLTGDRARQDADGRFVYLGRNDRQVKIRGHRIELGDIEAAIATLPGVRDVGLRAVPARPASSADLQSALSHLSEAEVKTLLIKAGGFP